MDQIVFNIKYCVNTTQPATRVIRIAFDWRRKGVFLMMEIKRDAGLKRWTGQYIRFHLLSESTNISSSPASCQF